MSHNCGSPIHPPSKSIQVLRKRVQCVHARDTADSLDRINTISSIATCAATTSAGERPSTVSAPVPAKDSHQPRQQLQSRELNKLCLRLCSHTISHAFCPPRVSSTDASWRARRACRLSREPKLGPAGACRIVFLVGCRLPAHDGSDCRQVAWAPQSARGLRQISDQSIRASFCCAWNKCCRTGCLLIISW